ncbi:MAG TPA: serine/threonine protein kinase [Polyangiaceae bacterium]
MSTQRIGNRQSGKAPSRARTSSRTFLLTRALASPLGVTLVFPGLVLVVGLFLTLVGQRALKGSNVAMGRGQLADQAKLVSTNIRSALAQSDAILDRLEGIALEREPQQPLEPVAAALHDLLRGRAGVGYVSLSYPNGTFEGTYVDKDGAIRFQESHLEGGVTSSRRFDYGGHSQLKLVRSLTSDYDPRTRDFYLQAVAAGGRVWTKPYPFFESHYTGITRAMPVYRSLDGQRQLHAVLTIDFDVSELSRLLKTGQLPDTRTLLFTGNGTLLAFPEGQQRIANLPLRSDRPLSYRDLNDAALDAFFSERKTGALGDFLTFEDDGRTMLAMQARVSDDPALDWTVAYLVPESVFFASLRTYGRRSILIAAVAVLLTLAISIVFARLVVRVRREAAEAKAEAQRAQRQVRDLGSYRLVECLGKGGMGEVWRAEHRLLAREAAIKLIRIDGGEVTPDMQERFRREAQTLAALRSRNTIELFDYGVSDDGTFFYVMELLDGLDLDSLVHLHGPQPPGRVMRMLIQACRSLGEAHDVGLVHRDVKPANLFACRAADELDVIKVLDFGLVRSLAAEDSASADVQAPVDEVSSDSAQAGKLTQFGSVMGTPDFMAPEQAQGQVLDGRADIYALGCVGYWLLTGHMVFEKGSTMLQLVAHMTEEPPSPRQRAPQTPPALERIILDCLAKGPDQRPQRARELLERLVLAERELPREQQWTEERAQAWWLEHRPREARSSSPLIHITPKLLQLADEPELG